MTENEVCVTGVGAITPLGASASKTWENMARGKSGIQELDLGEGNPKVAGKINMDQQELLALLGKTMGDDFLKKIKKDFLNKMDRFSQLAVLASAEAINQAGLEPRQLQNATTVIGTSIGGIATLEEQFSKMLKEKDLSPYAIASILANMAPANNAIQFGCKGGQLCICSACASGGSAIGEAMRKIRHGYAKIAICGGVEAALTDFIIALFNITKALSNNPDPQTASRPFHQDRDGFVVAEGAGILVLESLESAKKRGAAILAKVAGYGESCDASSLTMPTTEGAVRAIKMALKDAGIRPQDIDLVNSHATSTIAGDINEMLALSEIFKNSPRKPMITANKSQLGHSLGASGAIEAINCIQSILYGAITPILNLDKIDPRCDLGFDFVRETRYGQRIMTVLSNAFGFGGVNTCLILKAV